MLKLLGRIVWGLAGALALIVAGFFLSAWVGSSIPRNGDWKEAETGIPIMVETNGVHTGIVMPVVTSVKDWRETFPSASEHMREGMKPTHISVGWGDREVFLTVPTWGDLKASTAVRIATQGGPAVMRIGHYYRPTGGPNHRWVVLREEEYARLVARIEAGLPLVEDPHDRGSHDSFDPTARVYDSIGHYTLGNTCNQWVGDTLATAGIEMGLWTPLAGGVMKWIPESGAEP
ncbi:DUF2459 domain-containing protein [Alteriqipengyuania sp.]|uniref:DUF2459 domain-containing protein n=1 Tax=Alteriqipengyuania sp. TaxID=2800692 RepID=UPI0035183A07